MEERSPLESESCKSRSRLISSATLRTKPTRSTSEASKASDSDTSLPAFSITSLSGDSVQCEAFDFKINDITLEDYLALSAQGWVWSGRVDGTGQRVAIKILRGNYVENAIYASLEAMICAKLDHPNIVHVDYIKPTGKHWVIVMDLVEGFNLSELMKSPGAKRVLEREGIGQLASAVSHLSRKKVVHRDIKPRNIVYRTDNQSPVLIDFSLAYDTSIPSLNQRSQIVGTYYYMSPDAFLAPDQPTIDWDCYSLGVTIAEAVGAPRVGTDWKDRQSLIEAKKSGEFDRRLHESLQHVHDKECRQLVRDLTSREPRRVMQALCEAIRWA